MKDIDVLCAGNAVVDIIARCDDAFLIDNGIIKGAMNLVDAERAELLYARMGPAIEASGGSAGNTAAGLASFGSRAAFLGKVADDQLGTIYRHDIRAQGVHYETVALTSPPSTARSMIFVTPDSQRSMNTYLGACVELGPEDVDPDIVARSKLVYFEGYLWDPPRAKQAIRRCAEIAHAHAGQVAMTLSDPFCVDRYRHEFLDLMRTGVVDMVFANQNELLSLYESDDLESAMERVRRECSVAIVTRGPSGSIILAGDERIAIEPLKVDKVVDTTGAGDLYAAGFLHGYTQGLAFKLCGDLGSLAAGLVIQQIGPRPMQSLKEAADRHGLTQTPPPVAQASRA